MIAAARTVLNASNAACASTTAIGSDPIRVVPTGWKIVVPTSPAACARSASLCRCVPGLCSWGANSAMRAVCIKRRAWRRLSMATCRSPSVDRYRGAMAGAARGSGAVMCTDPVLSGRRLQTDGVIAGNGCSDSPN